MLDEKEINEKNEDIPEEIDKPTEEPVEAEKAPDEEVSTPAEANDTISDPAPEEGRDYGDDGSDEMPSEAAEEPKEVQAEEDTAPVQETPETAPNDVVDDGVQLVYSPKAIADTKRAREEEEEDDRPRSKKPSKNETNFLWKAGLLAALSGIISFGASTASYTSTIKVMNDRLLHAEERVQYLEEKLDRLQESGAVGGNNNGGFDWSDLFPGSGDAEATRGVALGIVASEDKDGVHIKGFSEGSKAEEAGLKEEDIIKSIDGTEIKTVQQIHDFLNDKKAGDKVKVIVLRGEEEKEITVELVETDISSNIFIDIDPQPDLSEEGEFEKRDESY